MTAYEIVTEQILSQLENGTVPWRKPWRGSGWTPRNLISRKPYRGINVLILASRGFASPYWLTLNQANKLGGRIRKGEKSTAVVFWKQIKVEDVDAVTGERTKKSIPLLRYYRVFNVEQTDGIVVPESYAPATVEPIIEAEKIVGTMPARPVIQHGGDVACYSPRRDVVTMPPRASFDGGEHYYATLFHELGHSTGHASRLGRKGVDGETLAPFGSPDYSHEELVAEITSAFLCSESGIGSVIIENSAAYIASWLKALRDDRRMVVIAAAQAQKAADFILDRKAGEESEDEASNG